MWYMFRVNPRKTLAGRMKIDGSPKTNDLAESLLLKEIVHVTYWKSKNIAFLKEELYTSSKQLEI